MQRLDHENLDVYHLAIEFVALADEVINHLPRGRAYLADQLQRAATSIVLNIAEGAGEFSPNDKRRFYRMAKRSATECAAVFDVARKLDLIDPDRHCQARTIVVRIVEMMTRLSKSATGTKPGMGTGTGTGTGQGRKTAT